MNNFLLKRIKKRKQSILLQAFILFGTPASFLFVPQTIKADSAETEGHLFDELEDQVEGFTEQEKEFINDMIDNVTDFSRLIGSRLEEFFNKKNKESYMKHVSYFAQDLKNMDEQIIDSLQEEIDREDTSDEYQTALKHAAKIVHELRAILNHVHKELLKKQGSSTLLVAKAMSEMSDTVNARLIRLKPKITALQQSVNEHDEAAGKKVKQLLAQLILILNMRTNRMELLSGLRHRLKC